MKIKWTKKAAQQFDSIFLYIKNDDPNAALRVIQKIKEVVALLSEFPYLGKSGRKTGYRELFISRYPYYVVYKVYKHSISITAIKNMKQNY